MEYDFGGWATRNDLRCADGVTIRRDAFKHNDGDVVPLVWNHDHNTPDSVCGHALLENRPEGVYAYGSFNNTSMGDMAKELVRHGDITALSIYANHLTKNGNDVVHGVIREVSLVLAGANPGAGIDFVIKHGEESDNEAYIYTDEAIQLGDKVEHSAEKSKEDTDMGDDNEKTIGDIVDSMTDEQRNAMYAIVGEALKEAGHDDTDDNNNEEDKTMKHNAFDKETKTDDVLTHAEQLDIIKDAKRCGSMREAAIAHGITNIEYLFPDAQNFTKAPGFVNQDFGWITEIMNRVHHTPFSRVKSTFADITAETARAKGYIKGKKKVDEVFSLLKRVTEPQTVYKKQKLDRDDVIDITDFDVVAWMKTEMRMKLDEELAVAFLLGDGRLASSDDKIKEDHIRPIWTDDDLYCIHSEVPVNKDATDAEKAAAFIDQSVIAMEEYDGSGSPIMFMSKRMLSSCLLLKDKNGVRIYKNVNELATAMMVDKIVPVAQMSGRVRDKGSDKFHLQGIIVNPADYNVGADKGGAINMFDDFDIDYNQQKFLIETRCSGALIRPHSAIALEIKEPGGHAGV